MNASFCTDVQVWLTSLDTIAVPSTPPPALVGHVSGCAHCRAALLLMLVDLLHTPLDGAQTTCGQCEDDLPTYIDIECDEGITEALIAYPHVWGHLWTCADCAMTYQMITTLQGAEATGALQPIPLISLMNRPDPRRVSRIIKSITLPRILFTHILVPQLGPAWGQGSDDTVIHQEVNDSNQVTVTIRKDEGYWKVVITLDPPVDGDAVIALGATIFRARIGPNGVASVGPIPADMLTSPAGPAMAISIEPTEP